MNIGRINRIHCHPAESDQDIAPEAMLVSENWLNWNGDLDNQNDCQNDGETGNEYDIELDNVVQYPESSGQHPVSATQNVLRLIWAIQMSNTYAAKLFMTD